MKPDFSQLSPEERDMRMTALVLGELSEPEAEELRAAMAVDPDLGRAFEQRKRTMELVGATVSAHAGVPENAPTRLSDERRQKLLARFAASYVEAKAIKNRKREPRSLWYVPLSIAAILIALLGVAVAFIGGFTPLQRREEYFAMAKNEPEFANPTRASRRHLWRENVPLPKGGNAPASEALAFKAMNLGDDVNGKAAAKKPAPGRKLAETAQGVDELAKARRPARPSSQRRNVAVMTYGDEGRSVAVAGGVPLPATPPPVASPAPTIPPPLASSDGSLPAGGSVATLAPPSFAVSGSSVSEVPLQQEALDGLATGFRFKSTVGGDADELARRSLDRSGGKSDVAAGRLTDASGFFDHEAPADARYDAAKVEQQIKDGGARGALFAGRSSFEKESLSGKTLNFGGLAGGGAGVQNRDQTFGGFGRGRSSGAMAGSGPGEPASAGGGFGGGSGSQNEWYFGNAQRQSANAAAAGQERASEEFFSLSDRTAPAPTVSEAKQKLEVLSERSEQDVKFQGLTRLGATIAQGQRGDAVNGPVAAASPALPLLLEVAPSLPAQVGKDVVLDGVVNGMADKALKEVGRPVAQSAETDAPVARKPASLAPVPQPEFLTRENAFSTFSLNVADVSYKLAAASLERGVMPDAATIRTEEFINAFDYRDPQPAPGMPVAFASERARYPFAHNRDLLRLSVKTAARGREAGKPLNVVVLLDNSGSMERADRVRIIQECLRTLAGQFQPQDKLSVVTFARTPRLWVDGVSGTNAAAVAEQVGNLTPQGGTNLEDALDLAYRTAVRHFQAQSMNRVVLLTDGAANLGNVDPQALKAKVESYRKQGIALDSFGIGWEGYNDDLLENLTRNGDGRYGFINTPEEAGPRFAGQLAGALRVAASDVKVQVEFNPKRVSSWRQVGYAKHQLTKEQFRDNTVDAAEIGAAEAGNALYVVETKSLGEGPIATVRVRYKVPGTSDYYEHEWPVAFTAFAPPAEQASPAMRLAASSAAFSEWLAGNPFAGEVTTDHLLAMMRGVPETFGADPRPKQLEWMIRQAKSISGK